MCFVSCTDNFLPDESTFSGCITGSTPVSCFVKSNYSAVSETNDIELNSGIVYTITTSLSASETLSLSLDLTKINVNGDCTFRNLSVCYLKCTFIFI
jgi:hypothetical protein